MKQFTLVLVSACVIAAVTAYPRSAFDQLEDDQQYYNPVPLSVNYVPLHRARRSPQHGFGHHGVRRGGPFTGSPRGGFGPHQYNGGYHGPAGNHQDHPQINSNRRHLHG